MSKEVDKRVVYMIDNADTSRSVTISANALESIACFATLSVDGVYSVGGSINNENISKVGDSGVSGIKVNVDEKTSEVFVAIEMLYGYKIPALTKEIQEKIKVTIESMTDFVVKSVNIKITEIIFDK